MRGAAKVCVVGQTVVTNLFQGADPVGQMIRIRRLPFQVVGCARSQRAERDGETRTTSPSIPFTTAAKKVPGRGHAGERDLRFGEHGAALTGRRGRDDRRAAGAAPLAQTDDNDFVIRTQADIARARGISAQTMTILLSSVALRSRCWWAASAS